MTYDQDKSIKFMQQLRQEKCRQQFADILRRLPRMVGKRHDNLPKFCRIGLGAGMTDDQIYDAIMAHCGVPKLGEREVWQGIEAAKLPLGARAGTHFIKCAPEERRFVERMIHEGWGYTEDDIKDASPHLNCPVQIPRATIGNRSGAAATQISAMLGVDTFDLMDQFWIGCDQKSGDLVHAWDILHQQLRDVPCFITSNALTGALAPRKNKSGMTVRGDACVVAAKLLLLEFDDLTLEEQYAFWGRVLARGCFKVASIVYSGGKSLHGLVRVEGEYAAFRERVLRLCCSANDPRYHADRAVLHPAALTRLAGAIRPDTGRVQELIWANRP